VWDAITHPYMLFLSTSAYLPVMHRTAVAGLPWWRIVHLLSEVIGVVVVLALIIHIGRQRLLVRWHGPAPSTPARPLVFWPVAASSAAVLGAASLALPGNDIGIWVVASRWLGAVVLGILVAAAVARPRPS
jgi:hypothetical protein